MTAFHDDPAQKQALLAQITEAAAEAETEFPLLKKQAKAEEIEAIAQEFGLHPSLMLLVSAMQQGAATPEKKANAFLKPLVDAIPVGADTHTLARRWILWAWMEAKPSLRDRIGDPDLRGAGDAIAEMQRRVLAGETIGRPEWRAARQAFSHPEGGDVQAQAAGGIGAAAWDLETAPGAATDVLSAYLHLTWTDSDAEFNWKAEEDEAYRALINEASRLRTLRMALDKEVSASEEAGSADLAACKASLDAKIKGVIEGGADVLGRSRGRYDLRAKNLETALADARAALIAQARSLNVKTPETA